MLAGVLHVHQRGGGGCRYTKALYYRSRAGAFESKKMAILLTDRGIRSDDHDVGVGGEDVDESGKVRVAYLHRLELRRQFAVT